MEGKYVIVEIIPEAISPEKGNLVQISALKIEDLKLVDRFDYRICEEKIHNQDIKDLVSYDKESFTYLNSTNELLAEFEKWCSDFPILILDNLYTNKFLASIPNDKKSIASLFKMDYNDDLIEQIIKKYKLEPSNYIVDLLYEALIYESNDFSSKYVNN